MKNLRITTIIEFNKNDKYQLIDASKNPLGVVSYDEDDDEVTINFYADEKPLHYDDTDDLNEYIEANKYMFKKLDGEVWEDYNPNPEGNKTTDCTLRAYCKAENLEWDEAFDIAAKYGKDNADMMNTNTIVTKILTEHFGYEYIKWKKEDPKKTVKEFTLEHPVGTYILSMRNHVVAVVEGKYYDSWDSGSKKISGYYKKD